MSPVADLRTRPVLPFVDGLADHGQRIALRSEHGVTITYADLAGRVDALAPAFGSGRRLVLIAAANTIDTITCYLAALRSGHVVLLTSADQPDHLAGLVDRFDPDNVCLERAGAMTIQTRTDRPAHDLHPELALLLSTSGSTGAAKLVRLSNENLASNASAIAEYLAITPQDCAITSLPMQYCYGLSVLHSHLAQGAGIALTERSVTEPEFWRHCREAGATSLAGVPHTYELLDRIGFESMSLPSLRYLTQAGGRMAPDDVRRWATKAAASGWDFVVMYGQTEATARMAYLPPSQAFESPHSIGIAIPGGQFTIDDGELVYRGANVMLGYAETPADLALGRTVHDLRTGDLARMDDEGRVEIVGRRSRFVKVFGLRVDLDRVETILRASGIEAVATSVGETVVIGVPEPEQQIAARNVVKHEIGLSRSSVQVVVLPGIPRLPNGKPDYPAIADVARQSRPTEQAAPASDVRAQLAEAFAEILGIDSVDDAHTFNGLGGDSLSYVEMSLRLEEILGHLPHDWHVRTIEQLAAAGRPGSGRTTPARSTRRPRWMRTRQVEATVPIRAIAIVLIVGGHMGVWEWDGGAHVLMAIAGFSFARFQLRAMRTSDRVAGMVTSLARMAVPAVLFIGAMAALGLRWRPVNALLLNDYLGSGAHPMSWELWFIEALVMLLGLFALLFASRRVRELERANPLGFASTVLALGLAVRFTISAHDDWNPDASRPHSVLWLFALGWTIERSTTVWQRLGLTAVLAAAVWNLFSDDYRNALIFVGVTALIWVGTVRVPTVLVRPMGAVAGASLWIYLTHWQTFPPLVHHGANRTLALPLVILAGVVVWQIVRPATTFTERLVTRSLGESARHVSPASRQDPLGDGVAVGDFGGAELDERALR
jgi:acyl-CoA synthetase (AMP-forming)/AMP-acid ligase II